MLDLYNAIINLSRCLLFYSPFSLLVFVPFFLHTVLLLAHMLRAADSSEYLVRPLQNINDWIGRR